MRRGFLENGLLALVLCAPVSLIVIIKTDVWFTAYLKIPLVEPILWALMLVWIVTVMRGRERSVRFIPIPVCAFLSVAWLSAVTADGFVASCKEFIQYVDYFLLAYVLFLNVYDRARDAVIIQRALCILAGVVIAYGIVQYACYYTAPHLVSSLLDDRNMLGAFLAILLPVPYGVLLRRKRLAATVPLSLLIVAGILITTTALATAVLLIVLALMHIVGRIGVGPRSAVVFIAIAVALVSRVEVRSRGDIIFEPGSAAAYRRILERNIGMTARKEWYAADLPGGRGLVFSSSAAMPEYGNALYEAYLENEMAGRSRAEFIGDGRRLIRQRFLEWRAALSMLEEYPLLGIGPGNYRRYIGYHYRTFPRINTLEPSAQNGYLVLASTTGILGFTCFVWILLFLLNAARTGIRDTATETERGFGLGLFGALASFILANLFFDAASNHATMVLFVIVASLVTVRGGGGAPQRSSTSFRDRVLPPWLSTQK